jgi:hypothetical protein
MKKQKDNYKVIGRGKAGWHAKTTNMSSSGGSLETYAEQAAENCLVYDADATDYDLFAKLIIAGPMVDVDLPENTVDRFTCEDRLTAKAMLPGFSGGFEKLAELAIENENFRGLDKVSIDVFERLLRQLPGMKIGRVVRGQVQWETEEQSK